MKEYNSNYKTVNNRIPELDNIKGILILLVVFGHFIAGTNIVKTISIYGVTHYLIYSVHMPMFILISGLLSKKDVSLISIIRKYLIPYLIFESTWVLRKGFVSPIKFISSLLIPSSVYWYILCLGFLRYYCDKVNKKVCMITSVVCSIFLVFVSKEAWYFMSVGRFFLLIPIFLIGKIFSLNLIKRIKLYKNRYILCGLVCVILELFFLKLGFVDVTWATHDYNGTIWNLLMQYIYSILFTLGIFFLIVLIIPTKKCFLTKWGNNSLIVYLFHMYFVDFIKHFIFKYNVEWNNIIYLVSWVIAILITFVLSSNFINHFYNIFMNKVVNSIFIDRGQKI